MSPVFDFWVPGPPRARARVRTKTVAGGKPVHFTGGEDREYGSLVIDAWDRAGRPRLVEGPYLFIVEALFRRPRSHFNSKGELNAEGLRHPWCTRPPDGDSLLRWCDYLVRQDALPDDRYCVSWFATKDWETPQRVQGLYIRAQALGPIRQG